MTSGNMHSSGKPAAAVSTIIALDFTVGLIAYAVFPHSLTTALRTFDNFFFSHTSILQISKPAQSPRNPTKKRGIAGLGKVYY